MHGGVGIPLRNLARTLVCLTISAVAATTAANLGESSLNAADSCLLQQQSSSSRQLPRGLLEETDSTEIAGKSAPKRPPKSAPLPGGKTPPNYSPRTIPKTAPKSGGKTAPDRPEEDVPEEATPTAEPGMILSTPLDEIVPDKIMSQRAELHLTEGLRSMEDKFGSVAKFAEAVRRGLIVDMGLDPRRLVILNVLGKYLATVNESDEYDELVDAGHISRVDFEVYPGPPGVPTPADVIKRLAIRIRDMKGELAEGPTKNMMKRAALVIVQGLKAMSPVGDWQQSHSRVDEKRPHGGHHGRHNSEHGQENGHDEAAKERSKKKYPWRWYWWGNGATRSTALTALPLLLVLHIGTELVS